MAKFDFRLQSILNYKTQIEDKFKNELGKAIRKLDEEKGKLAALEKEREIHIFEINKRTKEGMTVEKIKGYASYITLLKDRAKKQKENINFARECVDKIRKELTKAVQEKEMLKKLRERKFQEFMKEQFKDEQKMNDEIINFKHKKKAIGEANG